MQQASEDTSAIEQLISTRYFPAMDEVSFQAFEPAFHPDARLSFVRDGRVVYLTLAEWKARLDAIRDDPDHFLHRERGDKRIAVISVSGDVAHAEIHMVYPSLRYTDLLQLARHEGRWLIVAKAFHMQAP